MRAAEIMKALDECDVERAILNARFANLQTDQEALLTRLGNLRLDMAAVLEKHK